MNRSISFHFKVSIDEQQAIEKLAEAGVTPSEAMRRALHDKYDELMRKQNAEKNHESYIRFLKDLAGAITSNYVTVQAEKAEIMQQ